jgi:hypothetical protein
MIKEITSTPTRATKIRKSLRLSSKEKQVIVKKHTPQKTLAIFVDGDFTRRQYIIIHSANKNIYPCYSKIQKVKKECYLKEEAIRVTETSIEVQLQSLLDNTVARLFKYLAEVIERCSKRKKKV